MADAAAAVAATQTTATQAPEAGAKAPVAPEQKPAEQKKPTSRDRLAGRYRKASPDSNYGDDADFEGMAADELEAFDKDRAARADMDKRMNDLFGSDSRAAKIFVDWANGRDPIENLLEAYGDDFLEALQSPEGKDKFKQALERWRTGKKADEEHRAAYDKNIDESARVLIKFADSKGIDDDTLRGLVEKAHSLANEVADGKFSEEFLEMLYKAGNYDKAVSEAREEGRVTGKNENIRKEIRRSKPSNGLPVPAGAQDGRESDAMTGKPSKGNLSMFGGIPVQRRK